MCGRQMITGTKCPDNYFWIINMALFVLEVQNPSGQTCVRFISVSG